MKIRVDARIKGYHNNIVLKKIAKGLNRNKKTPLIFEITNRKKQNN